MRGAQLAELVADPPAGVAETLDLVTAFDRALRGGLGRLDQGQTAALDDLAVAVAATPIGRRVGEAIDKIIAGSVAEEQLVALAAARVALLGAVHDALLDRLDAALDRRRLQWPETPAGPAAEATAGSAAEATAGSAAEATAGSAAEATGGTALEPTGGSVPEATGRLGLEIAAGPATGPLAGVAAWLTELAVAGWHGVGHDLVAAASQLLPPLWTEPALRRPAVLIDGFAGELRALCPVPTGRPLPIRRWADLWSRALLLTQPGHPLAAEAGAEPVSGRLLPLGVDVHEHGTAVQMQVLAVFEPSGGDGARLVRTSVSAAKVDTITGPALWQLLGQHPVLLGALAGRHALELTKVPLLPGGDLLWHDDRARLAGQIDPLALARIQLATAAAAPVAPLDRHPVRIAEPVLLEGYRAGDEPDSGLRFDVDDQPLAVTADRLPSCGPLTKQMVARSSACLGLLRWDGRWMLQPVAVQSLVKRQPVTFSTADWALGPTDPKVVKAEARTGDSVAVLRERAGRLLRR